MPQMSAPRMHITKLPVSQPSPGDDSVPTLLVLSSTAGRLLGYFILQGNLKLHKCLIIKAGVIMGLDAVGWEV